MCKTNNLGIAKNNPIRKALDYAADHGWVVSLTGGDHVRYDKENHMTVYSSRTPSCHRAGIKTIKLMMKSTRNFEEGTQV